MNRAKIITIECHMRLSNTQLLETPQSAQKSLSELLTEVVL